MNPMGRTPGAAFGGHLGRCRSSAERAQVSARDHVRLVVRCDDFGMCHAVSEGIKRAFAQGIVTTASTMAPCPWFGEAMAITKDLGIPVGAHQTLTCEWDYFRWRPLRDGPSLAGADGTIRPSVELARRHVQRGDVVRELLAQVDRYRLSDLEVLTDPRIRELIDELGVTLCFLPEALSGDAPAILDPPASHAAPGAAG